MYTEKKFEIVIGDYVSEEEVKEIVKDRITRYVDDNVRNTIQTAIQYAFYELLPKEYLEKLPNIVSEKIKDIGVTDIIGYPDSFPNSEARRVVYQTVQQNQEKITEICLKKFEEMDDYSAKEILVEALRKVKS